MIRSYWRGLPNISLASSLSVLALLLSSACTSVGPSSHAVNKAPESTAMHGIAVIDVNEGLAQSMRARPQIGFAETLGDARRVGEVVGSGDVLEITIWEAPPAALFGVTAMASSVETSRSTSLPEFRVGPSGSISVPFAGIVPVAGRTLPQIESDIVGRLRGKAHLPQVMVRLTKNLTANVTVVGEVANSTRMDLTPKGEHLLDALAAAGGTRQPVNKITIQVTRGGIVQSMPLEAVIRDPRQNIILRTDDVITALYQPYSFTVLGAAGKNEEVNFEATGLTLAQALGRMGGLQDGRADAKGMFLFRWEDPALVGDRAAGAARGPDGRVPVIYRINMKDPVTYFAMQSFDMHQGDVVFIANNPVSDFQRFVGIIVSTVFPIVSVENALSN